MDKELIKKIIKAADYVENGDPLKDVMDDHDLGMAIVEFAGRLKKEFAIDEQMIYTGPEYPSRPETDGHGPIHASSCKCFDCAGW